MSFNNLEERVSLLYNSINCHFEKFKKPEPLYEETLLENGKRQFTIKIGGGETKEKEKLEGYNSIKLIISNLANLKDNLKNYFRTNLLNEKLVEENINDSLELSVIMDLSNQEKHGYPLTQTKRSKLDPKIINIQNSLITRMPLKNVAYDILEGNVEITADIVDSNDNLLFTFNDLIEKVVLNWEDFFLKHIPKVSLEINNKRKTDEKKQKKIINTQHLVDEVIKILEDCHWKNIDWDMLNLGMIVQNSSNGEFSDNITGTILDLSYDENSIPTVTLLSDLIPYISNFHAEKFTWRYIKTNKTNDIAILYYYFNTLPKLISEIID